MVTKHENERCSSSSSRVEDKDKIKEETRSSAKSSPYKREKRQESISREIEQPE